MSDLVERLAEKWATECGEHVDEPIVKKDVCFFVAAFADELERESANRYDLAGVADWLRSQASDGGR